MIILNNYCSFIKYFAPLFNLQKIFHFVQLRNYSTFSETLRKSFLKFALFLLSALSGAPCIYFTVQMH